MKKNITEVLNEFLSPDKSQELLECLSDNGYEIRDINSISSYEEAKKHFIQVSKAENIFDQH